MQKPSKHLFVCASFRATGEPQGVCHKKGAAGLLPYLSGELADRGLSDIAVTSTGCLQLCDKGPVLVLYPDNVWYGGVDEDAIDAILDAIEDGGVAEEYVIE
ncbi:MAG: (2Fe-2S) ferredoxin domain-containing protein [Spirochaetaceae bacterium]|nr:MAG: (2Fe-2S) ferredoxin domain-containing protein [Spirochaetaceae bacterium]